MSGMEIAMIGTIAGGLMQAKSQIDEGKAANNAAKYNAQLANIEGAQKASLIRQEGARRTGTIRANLGKSGATSAGTPMMVMAESAANNEIDALNALWSSGQEATLQRAQGRDAKRAGRARAATTLLTTASRAF